MKNLPEQITDWGKLRAVYKMSNLGVIDMYREEINTYNLRIPKAE